MTPAALILSSLGGIVAFLVAVIVTVRAIFRLVNSTDDNTVAVRDLKAAFEGLSTRVNSHDIDIQVLKDRIKR